MPNTLIKPWGKEILLTTPDLPYTGKILYLNANSKFSLQYHDQKIETLSLIQGQALLTKGPDRSHLETIQMDLLHGYTIPVNTIHRIEAQTDCIILETSSPETGTTFRLEDDFHRPDETESLRNLPNRGWKNPNE